MGTGVDGRAASQLSGKSWPHSGLRRPRPLALERLQYLPQKHAVRLRSDKPDGPTAGTHDFPALDFLARLLAHVPDAHEVVVRGAPAGAAPAS